MKFSNTIICAYLYDKFFADKKIVKVSTRRTDRIISHSKTYLDLLVKNGYIAIWQKGGFRQGATVYQVIKPYRIVDFSKFSEYVDKKTIRRAKRINNLDGFYIPVTDASQDQQAIIDKINSACIDTKQSNNGRVWTTFSNLSKEHRRKTEYKGEKLVEIDINATIPRLLPTFIKNHVKEWVGDRKDAIYKQLEQFESCLVKQDAYCGIISALGLDIDRNIFKKQLLPILFGAGTKETIQDNIANAFIEKWPDLFGQIKHFSQKYRYVKDKDASYKAGMFAQKIFAIESRIINNAARSLKCPKATVYDCLMVPASFADMAQKAILTQWEKVVGDSASLRLNVIGNPSPSVQAVSVFAVASSAEGSDDSKPETLVIDKVCADKQKKRQRIEGGEGSTIIGSFSSLSAQTYPHKTRNRQSKIRQLPDGRFTISIKNKNYTSRKGQSKEEFERVIKQILEQ